MSRKTSENSSGGIPASGRGSPEQLPELYNVDADPSEASDIASSHVDTAIVLMAALLRMSADATSTNPVLNSDSRWPNRRPPIRYPSGRRCRSC